MIVQTYLKESSSNDLSLQWGPLLEIETERYREKTLRSKAYVPAASSRDRGLCSGVKLPWNTQREWERNYYCLGKFIRADPEREDVSLGRRSIFSGKAPGNCRVTPAMGRCLQEALLRLTRCIILRFLSMNRKSKAQKRTGSTDI